MRRLRNCSRAGSSRWSAVVSQAVQQAANDAVRRAAANGASGGVTLAQLQQALDEQVRGIADQLTEFNAAHYLDIPDGARVATVRRVPPPALAPHELETH